MWIINKMSTLNILHKLKVLFNLYHLQWNAKDSIGFGDGKTWKKETNIIELNFVSLTPTFM
jgi:hypothetical protein